MSHTITGMNAAIAQDMEWTPRCEAPRREPPVKSSLLVSGETVSVVVSVESPSRAEPLHQEVEEDLQPVAIEKQPLQADVRPLAGNTGVVRTAFAAAGVAAGTTTATKPRAGGALRSRAMMSFQWAKDAASKVGEVAKTTGDKIGEVAKNTGDTIKHKDWTKEKEAWENVKTGTTKTMATVGTKATEGGTFLKRQASATMKRIGLSKEELEVRCRQEVQATPCPRLLLVCCNFISAGNLEQHGIFKDDGPADLVDMLYSLLVQGNGVVVIPKGTTPNTAAGVMKKYLTSLPEPLLTFKLFNEFIMAGHNTPQARALLQQLPPANYNSLTLLLEAARRVADGSAINGMTSAAIAAELAPCMMWHPPLQGRKEPGVDGSQTPPAASLPMNSDELSSIANVLQHLIDSPST